MSEKVISGYICNHIGGVVISILKSCVEDRILSLVKPNTIKSISSLLDRKH